MDTRPLPYDLGQKFLIEKDKDEEVTWRTLTTPDGPPRSRGTWRGRANVDR